MSGGGGPTQQTQTSDSYYAPAKWIASLGQGIGTTGAGAFNDVFGNATNISGMAPSQFQAAGGTLANAATAANQAAQKADMASTFNQSTFQNQFMNPYVKDVVNQMSLIGNRDFNQQNLPSLQAAMGASGQFNSGRANQTVEQAQRDAQMNILTNQQTAMNQAYQNSMQNYLGSMNTGVAGANAMNQAGQVMGQAGSGQSSLGQAAINTPGNVFGSFGSALSNLPYAKGQSSSGSSIEANQLGFG